MVGGPGYFDELKGVKQIWIGNSPYYYSPFPGLIDEVRVYDSSLSQEDIIILYQGQRSALEQPEIAPMGNVILLKETI